MNRLFVLAPVALLSTACAVRTPASALDFDRSDALPATHAMNLPSDAEVMAAWQLPAESPWSRYEKLTLLTYLADRPTVAEMPDVASIAVVRRAEIAAERLAMAGLPAGTLWIVDLRGAASVAFGAALSRSSMAPVAPVLTFNNWPAEHEVVPVEQTLAALVTMRPRPLVPAASRLAPAAPVFLLDAWRLALRDRKPDPEAVDNRYMLLPSDFPDAATLLAMGITRVVYVVEDQRESTTEEDDVHEVALDYQNAGIALAMADLRGLTRVGGAERGVTAAVWDDWFEDRSFQVENRSTIFDDPAFYERARGGFGGTRAAPPGAHGHTSIGGAHSHAGHAGHAGHGHPSGGGRTYSGATPHASGHGGG